MRNQNPRRPYNGYSNRSRNIPQRSRRAYREDPYIRDLNEYYQDSFEDRYEESDHNIYEDEFETSRNFRSYPRNNNSGYGNVRGLRNSGPYSGPDDQGYDDREDTDEDYDYSYDPYYRDDEGDYEYADEYADRRKKHAPVDEYEDEKWDYAPGSRSYRSGLNRRIHSDLYNGLMGGYDY